MRNKRVLYSSQFPTIIYLVQNGHFDSSLWGINFKTVADNEFQNLCKVEGNVKFPNSFKLQETTITDKNAGEAVHFFLSLPYSQC